jgi:hypothetical protein
MKKVINEEVEWSKKGGWGFHWGSSIKHSTPNLYVQSSFSYRERERPNGLLEINIVCTDQQFGSIFFLSLNIIILSFFLSDFSSKGKLVHPYFECLLSFIHQLAK